MDADIAKLSAGLLLAQGQSPGNPPVIQWGLAGLIAWMVVRECFALVRWALDRKKTACRNCEELINLRLEVERLKHRVGDLAKTRGQ